MSFYNVLVSEVIKRENCDTIEAMKIINSAMKRQVSKVIYFDMDGTLTRYDQEDFTPSDGSIPKYTLKGYFATRTPQENMVAAAKILIKRGYDVRLVSAVDTENPYAEDDKDVWNDNIFGSDIPAEKRIYVPLGENKSKYVSEPGVLIDDYNKNLFSWSGKAIKVLNGVNGGSHEWKSYTIKAWERPDLIADEIEKIVQSID